MSWQLSIGVERVKCTHLDFSYRFFCCTSYFNLRNKKAGTEAIKKGAEQSQWLFGAELGTPVSASTSGAEGSVNGVEDHAGEVTAPPVLKDVK